MVRPPIFPHETPLAMILTGLTLLGNLCAAPKSPQVVFGRSADKPVFIDDRTRAASVRVGELKMLELDAKPAAPIPDEPVRLK